MAKEKSVGIIIYPEDMARIKKCVKPEYQFAVVWALSQYATDGILPTEAELGEGGMVAFEFIVEKVRDALETYKANSEKRKAAANARWNAEESKPMQTDANGCKRMQTDADATKTETETETETEYINRNRKITGVVEERNVSRKSATAPAAENVIAFDGQDLTADIERNHEADALVMRYGLSKDYATRERLLEDLEKYGSAKLREALEKAVDGNQRERITPNFWRAILAGKGRDSPTNNGVGYGQVLTQREYTPEEFKVMEVAISAIDSHGRLPGELGYGT